MSDEGGGERGRVQRKVYAVSILLVSDMEQLNAV